jgi:hypothetical protein
MLDFWADGLEGRVAFDIGSLELGILGHWDIGIRLGRDKWYTGMVLYGMVW